MATQQINSTQFDPIGEDWHIVGDPGEPGFEDSWVAYGGGYTTPSFYKDPGGVVHLKGLLKSGSIGTGNAMFTLPKGYRPVGILHFAVEGHDGTKTNRIKVYQTGAVEPGVGSSNGHFCIDGIKFKADM